MSTRRRWRCGDLLCCGVFFACGALFTCAVVFDRVVDVRDDAVLLCVARDDAVLFDDLDAVRDVDVERLRGESDDDRCWRVRRDGCDVVAVTVLRPPVTSDAQRCQVVTRLVSQDPCRLCLMSQLLQRQ